MVISGQSFAFLQQCNTLLFQFKLLYLPTGGFGVVIYPKDILGHYMVQLASFFCRFGV
jgi:hypothetical protein